ncbi:MAG: YraN family protein [Saprospiraceae bacterium]|nr:YraN family protein [Saprospiraceae bacterium]
MAKQQEIGRKGERLAIDYLEHKGYHILEVNWRFKRAEVDIIAQYDRTIIFVEVKTRSYDTFGAPDLAINSKKENLISSAAHAYIDQQKYEGAIRFDVISIVMGKNKMAQIEHIEDAFFLGL